MKRFLAGLAVVSVAACSNNNMGASNGFDSLLNADVAQMSAEAVGRDVEMMHGPGGPMGFGFRADPANFDCTDGSRDGLTATRTCTYKDAAGNVQAGYDSTTTASVTVHAHVSGTLNRGPMTATVDNTRDFTVSGLAGAETQQTWNGTGSGTDSHVRQSQDGSPRQFDMTHTESIVNLVIPVPHTPTGWPLSGTVTTHATVKITGGQEDGTTKTKDVVTTFNGTQYATVTVNGDTFTVDLAGRGRPRHGH